MDIGKRLPLGLLIGGELRGAASDGRVIDVVDPANGAVIASVPSASIEDADDALDAAEAAATAWAATAPRQRSEILSTAFRLMTERSEELSAIIVAENGKTLTDARGEVAYAAEFFRWYAEEAVRVPGKIRTAPSGTNRILVQYRPVGICVLVTPWNFPAAMITRKLGPALAAGCTAIVKPASETPLTALAIADILREAGLPGGVVNVIPSDRSRTVVAHLLQDPRTRKLSFTGSTEIGRQLLVQAADSVMATSMELGGNAPFIVFDDADLDEAVAGAMVAKMRNGGEACTAANRFYVQRGVAQEFAERLTAAMSRLRTGPGNEEGVELGPLVNEAARTKVDELVRSAIEAGGTVLCGGVVPSGQGWFYPATVIADVPGDARILGEEIFGPVAPIAAFDTEEDAIRLANDTPFGLSSYLFTADLARGLRVAGSLEAGMVGLNRGLVSDPAAPFGGVKQSGLGREGGEEGLLEYLESQYISVAW